jgi:peroxiredoxin
VPHWSLAVAAACSITLATSPCTAAPQPGEQAPDFTLEQLDGGPVSLSDFDTKIIFINFFGYN